MLRPLTIPAAVLQVASMASSSLGKSWKAMQCLKRTLRISMSMGYEPPDKSVPQEHFRRALPQRCSLKSGITALAPSRRWRRLSIDGKVVEEDWSEHPGGTARLRFIWKRALLQVQVDYYQAPDRRP